MGLFDEVAGGLLKQVFSNPNTQKALLEMVMGLLTGSGSTGSGSRGLDGMAQRFDENGLGDIMSSWIGKGENLPISPEQILQVLGSGQIQQAAQKMGVSSNEASSGLAELLPLIVDQLTPEGSVPKQDTLNQSVGMVLGQLFGR
jgi:uncharacterized protein YidB (DUF937 family)